MLLLLCLVPVPGLTASISSLDLLKQVAIIIEIETRNPKFSVIVALEHLYILVKYSDQQYGHHFFGFKSSSWAETLMQTVEIFNYN